jgi:transposase
VAKVIAEEYGVSYDPGHVSRLLKKLHWTPQVPMKRALQRDEAEIEHWRTVVWPSLLARARRERQTPIFIDESGFYLLPGLVRTYAPEGRTPIIRPWHTRDHLSVMAGLTPQGKIYVLVRRESLNGLHTVEYLHHLIHYLGPRLLVIWDGSPIHRRTEVKKLLNSPAGRKIQVVPLPAYAPDLNPLDQGFWQQLKHVELRNVVCLDLEELHLQLHLAIGRLRQKPQLIRGFFACAGLTV